MGKFIKSNLHLKPPTSISGLDYSNDEEAKTTGRYKNAKEIIINHFLLYQSELINYKNLSHR